MADKNSGLTKQDIDKLLKNIKLSKDFLKVLRDSGVSVPDTFLKSLNRLEAAIKAGKGVAEAAEEASAEHKALVKALENACKELPDYDDQGVCEAGIARQWQAQGTKITFDLGNPKSVSRLSLKKLLQSYLPDTACKHLDYCAKVAE